MHNAYTKLIETLPELRGIPATLRAGRCPLGVTGLYAVHKAHLCASVCVALNAKLILLAPDEGSCARLAADMQALGCAALVYPARELIFTGGDAHSHEYEQKRIGVLSALLRGECSAVVTTAEAAAQRTLDPQTLSGMVLDVRVGSDYHLPDLTERLVLGGYTRCDQVEGAGQFSLRGGILDVYPPGAAQPYRLDFWGDTLDTLAAFDPETQRRGESLSSARIPPSAEVRESAVPGVAGKANTAHSSTLFDYLPDAILAVSETFSVKESFRAAQELLSETAAQTLVQESARGKHKAVNEFVAAHTLDWTQILGEYEHRRTLFLDTFPRGSFDTPVTELFSVNAQQPAAWSGSLSVLREDILPLLEQGGQGLREDAQSADYANHIPQTICVIAQTEKTAEALAADLARDGVPAVHFRSIPSEFPQNTVSVLHGALSAGFAYEQGGFTLFSAAQKAEGSPRRRAAVKHNSKNAFTGIEELRAGDYVVHAVHGIGVFDGVTRLEAGGAIKDYIKIRYDKRDVLYVPVTQLDQVTKYIGPHSDDRPVKLSRLGGGEWEKAKFRARGAVKDIAKQLIALYAKRAAAPGHAFASDDDMQQDFAARFPYQETADQLRCIDQVKQDMESPHPMDRLLCGDVGFGKTEVALRAAFKCAAEGKQCAMLVPTTILALQHYQTAKARFDGFPIDVRMLSRFVSAAEQKKTLEGLKRGSIEFLIGTHRILTKDLQFHNLGLLIVDEEQRFGVEQKEKLKERFPDVDVLTLTATPIPRTLNMAMSGVRDMSTLEEAPQDRHPVQTYVLEHNQGLLAQAIRAELRRGGQVYYLHNRVESIHKTAETLQELLPEARIGVGHGKMREEELSDIWRRLLEGEIDILVCTTIIEAGVDVPNVNTLIIEDADRFGLSQLHQIRGRVGRSARRASAYFTFRRGKELTEIAQRRLAAIREYTQFGSGFAIAMRDLELRGTGNILGAQQSGNVEAVGYEMYLRILEEAVREMKGEGSAEASVPCLIDLPVDAHIPDGYISSVPQRLGIYRRIAEIRSAADAQDVTDELLDRFGEPPAALMGLIQIALLRAAAEHLRIPEIRRDGKRIILFMTELDPVCFRALTERFSGRVKLSAKGKTHIALSLLPQDDQLAVLKAALEILAE
ncbi:MAG: transcription-repair coupling factor [Oscillospiraceae bacterium]|jgi:transcription-repair coupling factor (superfamily II helicase)|nr:transcription-repair coupling factor [Oscillospiraceae bacterium]